MLEKLKKFIPLSHRVAVYVPATVDVDTAIDNAEKVAETAAFLSRLFGGATATDALGFWVSDAVGLVKERTTIVYAYAENLEAIEEVIDYCDRLKKDMSQEAVSLEVDGQLYFI